MEFLEMLYDAIYFVGIQTLRYGKRFLRWLLSLILKPIKAISTMLITLAIIINKYALKTFRKTVNEIKNLIADAKEVFSKKSKDYEKKEKKKLSYYVSVAVKKYKTAFTYTMNLVIPAVSLVLLLNVVGLWSETKFALQISYKDEVIGYVQNEDVYKEARKLAYDRLDTGTNTLTIDGDNSQKTPIINTPEYKIVPVKRSQINTATEICDKLIEKSNSKITNACGVYIDGEFVCAVKNETDALSVFDTILSENETGDANAVVSFVENIDYIQGLYPDNENTIKDAAFLQQKLKTNKRDAKYYTVLDGDTLSKVAEKFELSASYISELNPHITEDLLPGENLLVQKEEKYIQVQTTKTEYSEVEIPFETIKINTDTLYIGDSRTVTKGQKGLEKVTQLVTYIDGAVVSSREVSRTVVKESVSEKIHVGTKKSPYSSGGAVSFGGKFVWPAIGAFEISSYYGARDLGDGWHDGIDIVRPGGSTGCTIIAAESGTVVHAGWKNTAGYAVIIDHGNGIQTRYYHMKQGSIVVSAGQKVSRGQPIGQIGATGFVTGPHLHFEVRVNGKGVNPLPYLK
ncbi:MAG: peptidoglycan DD-metalloendopeptidase family protein [Clostridia bacterium]|nr:peptidoglycan DD-metalloendopeptidase family protein [Clostridia bacterium]